jgi:hypothetical protein
VIILVIAILVAVGVLAGALAALAGPIFAQAEVTRNLNDTGAAIDAGIEHGIQTFQRGLLANPGQCPPAPQPPQQLTNPPSVNGLVPIVTCQTVSSLPWISKVVLTSSPPLTTNGRVFSARAVVEVNTLTGATTILSWKTCQDPGPC